MVVAFTVSMPIFAFERHVGCGATSYPPIKPRERPDTTQEAPAAGAVSSPLRLVWDGRIHDRRHRLVRRGPLLPALRAALRSVRQSCEWWETTDNRIGVLLRLNRSKSFARIVACFSTVSTPRSASTSILIFQHLWSAKPVTSPMTPNTVSAVADLAFARGGADDAASTPHWLPPHPRDWMSWRCGLRRIARGSQRDRAADWWRLHAHFSGALLAILGGALLAICGGGLACILGGAVLGRRSDRIVRGLSSLIARRVRGAHTRHSAIPQPKRATRRASSAWNARLATRHLLQQH